MKLLVTGTHGQLASALRKRPGGDELVFVGRPAFDLTRPETIAPMVEAVRPAAIISAAAYTDVNGAETDAQTARAVNGKAPGALAQSAAALGIPLVHFSTDYVFDGQKPAPYRETDPCAPLGVYGSSKLDGEEQVRQTYSNHAILRTSWVYSPFGKNFVRTMLELARSRDALQVVNDQFGNPTSALDLADGALQIAHALASDPDNRTCAAPSTWSAPTRSAGPNSRSRSFGCPPRWAGRRPRSSQSRPAPFPRPFAGQPIRGSTAPNWRKPSGLPCPAGVFPWLRLLSDC